MNNDSKTADQLQPQTPTAPISLVGVPNKEAATAVSEFVRPAGPEVKPSLSPEVSEAGVEVKTDRPDLTFEHKEIGLDHAGATQPVLTIPTGKVRLPMTEEEVANQLKVGQDDDSRKWLAGVIDRVIKALGL